MKTILLSSLNKVFKDTEPNYCEFNEFSCLKNERFSFQLAFMPECKEDTELTVSVKAPFKDICVYLVKNIPSEKTGYDNSDSFHYDLSRKEFPDLLCPITDEKIKIKKGEWHSIWVEVLPAEKSAGKKSISVALKTATQEFKKTFSLNVINASLPPQTLLYTNWFHNDCLCTYYGVEPFSDEYWVIVENYIQNAVAHGVTMLLTPIFTPPLDTQVGGERPTVQLVKVTKQQGKYSFNFDNFEKYVAICLKNGIQAFEISHLFTQWGAEFAPKIVATVNSKEKRIFGWETKASGKAYTEFLEAFAKEFKKEVNKLGIKSRCWMHVSDEPNEKQLKSYTKAADIVKRLFKGFNSLDALSDIEFFHNKLIKTPVCGEDEADVFRPEVKNFWTYYCCTQVHSYLPNRMFSQPSQRNRILGVLLYKYKAQGFLQWGHNFWYSQYSKHPIDPFKVSDAGNAFPSGDAYVVYPGENGTPLNSLRHKVFADAMQDLRALNLLEEKIGRRAVMKILEKDLDTPLTFKTYPHEYQWLLNLRKEINKQL
ncbi:MAG: DUF4091 domain-containing protein [Clostridia bacterium]|nr:DUF4091 domain-containing protein [Clostridia bacterium]